MSKWIWACGMTAVLVGCNSLDRQQYDLPQRAPSVNEFSQSTSSSQPYWSQQNRATAQAHRQPTNGSLAQQASQSGNPSNWRLDGSQRTSTTPSVNALAANPPVRSSPYDMTGNGSQREYRETGYSLRPASVDDRPVRYSPPSTAAAPRTSENPLPQLARPLLMAGDNPATLAGGRPAPSPALKPPSPVPELPEAPAMRTEARTPPPVEAVEPKSLPPLAAKPLPAVPQPVPTPAPSEIKQATHTTAATDERPSGAPPVRMVNTKRVVLNYKVDDVGPSGLSAVDLWMTRDGRQWQKADNGHSGPPFVTEVTDEGMYGFTLVARSGIGLGKEPPKPGDMPQVWVEVDLSRPAVSLAEVKHGLGPKAREININWTASDRNLARRPVTISYAESSTGPWTPLAANIENTGNYVWTMTPGAPVKFFVRVEAVDLVGNVGAAQTTQAMLIDMSQPSVSILNVEPSDR